jgi:hypothetical protein
MYLHVKIIIITFGLVVVSGVLYLFRSHIPSIPILNRDQEIVKPIPEAISKNAQSEENKSPSTGSPRAKHAVDEYTRAFNDKLNLVKGLFQKEEFNLIEDSQRPQQKRLEVKKTLRKKKRIENSYG